MTGSANGDALFGFESRDPIDGGGGSDDLFGSAGVDVITGGGDLESTIAGAADEAVIAGVDIIAVYCGDTGVDEVADSSMQSRFHRRFGTQPEILKT